jgi:glucose/arabinose dehydrogenase
MKKLTLTLMSIVALGIFSTTAFAQDATKTPMPTEATATPQASGGQALSEPFTQDDLTLLTGNVQRPNGIAWFNDNLYIACTGDSTVYEVQSRTGETITYTGGMRNAHALHAEMEDEAVTLWIPDFQANSLVQVRNRRTEVIASGLQGPWGIAFLNDERFIISNILGNNLVSVTREGEITALLDELASPTGVAIDGDNLYVANNGSARRAIEWYPLESTNRQEEGGSLVSGLQNVTNIVMGTDENLYFSYSLGTRGVVGRVSPTRCMENGGCDNTDVEIVVYSELQAPIAGLTVSPDMRLFLHTIFAPDIYWVQLPRD